ncbi:MAG TPA: hypothetical protein VF166_06635 [Gemmatimonadaceae bacterium]
MTTIALHPAPRWKTVAKEQISAVGVALRTESILFLCALGLIAVLAIINAVRAIGHVHNQSDFGFGPAGTIPITLVGFVLPFSVWRSEDPARRSYHWAMPAARAPHTLTKTAAGWLWLMAAVVTYLVFIVVLGQVVAHIDGYGGPQHHVPAWQWVLPFTSATIAYLLGSTTVIASDHPWRWIMGVIVAYAVTLMVFNELGWDGATRAWDGIVNGYHGLRAAIFGDVRVRHEGASAARWISATAIWGALGALMLAGALLRRGDE